MRGVLSRQLTDFANYFGRCTTCMRQSLAAALTMWAVYAIGATSWPGILGGYVIGAIAAASTVLWLLHIAGYGARAVVEARDGSRTFNPSAHIDSRFADIGRRQAIRTLSRAVGAGVVASVPILVLPSAAFAFCGQCTTSRDCGVGWVCRNTAPVNSGKICNECVKA